MVSNNATSAAYPRIYGVHTATHDAEPFFQLSCPASAYMLSSSTSSAGVTETPLMPVAVLSAPRRVPEQLSLNGVPTGYNAYQPHACVGDTNSGPCPSYCSLGSACRLYYGTVAAMPIESHPSAEAPTIVYAQQLYSTGQPSSTNIARSHSQQPLILPASSSFDIPGTYQQHLQPLVQVS